MSNKNLLLLAHDGEDFYKARLPFAHFLRDQGYKVFVILPNDKYTDLIRKEGFEITNSSIERDNTNPIHLLKAVFEIRRYARTCNADIVHSFKFIPNLMNFCANLLTTRKTVLHIAGLGIAFANPGLKFRILKWIQQVLFFLQFLRADLVIIQNPDDYNDFLFKKLFRKKIRVVKGSGVDILKFSPLREQKRPVSGKKVFLCTTRLIWEKGIREMVEAFESLPANLRAQVELRIIGEPDTKNPRGVTPEYVEKYKSSTTIRFLGRQDRIQEHLCQADVFILPSYYREGIPRSILEALASGLPVITTSVPGCKLTIVSNQNGLLIEPRSVEAIRTAVENMLANEQRWPEMGAISRELAIAEFSENKIFSEIVKLYAQ